MKKFEPTWRRAFEEFIIDDKGKKYIDFTSGVITTNLGHANPAIVKAITKIVNASLLFSYRYPFAEKELLRKKLLDFTGNIFSDVCFTAIGAEAVENTMVICSRYFEGQNRNTFIAFSNAYHGKTLGAATLGDIKRYKSKVLMSDSSRLVKRLPYPSNPKEAEEVIKQLSKIGKQSMAVYIEGVQGSSLLKASKSFVQNLRKWTEKNNVLLIFDEIQTGFYRTGSKFSYLDAGIKPDMICIGKGLTSSLPLSAVLLNKKLAKFTDAELDASTHSGNPVAIAASLACLKEYQSKSFLNTFKMATLAYGEMMKEISSRVNSKIQVIYPGGVFGGLKFDLQSAQKNSLDDFVYSCRMKGLFLSLPIGQDSNIVKFTPPLIIKPKQLKLATKIMLSELKSRGYLLSG